MALAADMPEALSFVDVAAALKSSQSADLRAVDTVILDTLESGVPLIPQVARHLISAGGKRLRPLLALASAKLCGEDGERPHLLAAAVELIHAATLLHDDVVDDSALRRGLATANIVFGNKESVLVGDFLFARAFELMVKTGSLEVLDILSRASCTISEGEVLQLETQSNIATTEDMYLSVVQAKTAALFAAATEASAVLGGGSPEVVRALREFGLNFGIAYQLVDDTLDYAASDGGMGKTAGDDFREGKMTLPVIYAIADAQNAEERDFWHRTMVDGHQREGDFLEARRLIDRDDLIERALGEAQTYAARAAAALSSALPETSLRGLLEDLATSSAIRRF